MSSNQASISESLPLLSTLIYHPHLLSVIRNLGYHQATTVQAQAIPLTLASEDLCVSAETGSGKTMAFLLPCVQKLLAQPPISAIQLLILTPTRELAQQIHQITQSLIAKTPLSSALITGRDDFIRQQKNLRRQPQILIATPGRFVEHLSQYPECLTQLQWLVIDEADRMLDMGFSPDVLSITQSCPSQRQTLLYSATLTARVKRIAQRTLQQPKFVEIHAFRKHLPTSIVQQVMLSDDKTHKQLQLTWLLKQQTFQKAIVFTNTKLQAQDLEIPLRNEKLRVCVLHGDLEQTERNRVMALYRKGLVHILVATDLAARGLDVDHIDLVINFDMARNASHYVHRIGRCGRAGESGVAISLIEPNEWNKMASIERYLNRRFEPLVIDELKSRFQGPQKRKKSGKAASDKKRPEVKKTTSPKVKIRDRDKKNIGKRRLPSNIKNAQSTYESC